MNTGAVMVTAQCMANQNCIVLGSIETAIGFITERQFWDRAARLELKRFIRNEILRLDQAHLAFGGSLLRCFRIIHFYTLNSLPRERLKSFNFKETCHTRIIVNTLNPLSQQFRNTEHGDRHAVTLFDRSGICGD